MKKTDQVPFVLLRGDRRKTVSNDQVLDYCKAIMTIRGRARQPPDEFAYCGMEDYLLQHAQFWTPKPLPRSIPRGPIKQCFDNAYQAAVVHGLLYVEGVAAGIIPVHHAWCVTSDDVVVDPTWRKGFVYFGCVFDLSTVEAARCAKNGSVFGDFPHGYPVFRTRRLPPFRQVGVNRWE